MPPLSSFSRQQIALSLALIIAATMLGTGCGSSGSSVRPQLNGNTSVTVLLTGTANDQLAEFNLGFQGIALTGQSGRTATLLSTPASGPLAGAEFMHINGTAEPLVTASISQDVYTSATVSVSAAEFSCIAFGAVNGEETLSSAFYSTVPASVTVTLPSPITVTGSSMALSLNLMVSQSATIGDCLNVDGFSGFSIMPVFTLIPYTAASLTTNAANGKVSGVDGQISAMGSGGNSFTLSLSSLDGPTMLSISSGSDTVYQGTAGFSALAVGTFVDMDGAVQSDGSVLATRIAVEDPSAADVFRGPLLEVAPSASIISMRAREQQGKDFPGYVDGFGSLNIGSASFQISGQMTNLGSLPFVPSFNASNMVPGQEVYVSIPSFSVDLPYPIATTMTLMPQIINGTVTASSPSGTFTDYTIALASYDLFPLLAVQPGQTTVENNPGQVEVYVDSNTQLVNTQSLASGNTFRFYGLVFNDNGTLRMDCAQVNDGVAFMPTSSASQQSQMQAGVMQQKRAVSVGSTQETTSMVTRQP